MVYVSQTIADCTKDMDSTTWNSYQIVSNRARALCYATQQQQFRHLTELTVNQLVSTAHGQLEYMKELQVGQSVNSSPLHIVRVHERITGRSGHMDLSTNLEYLILLKLRFKLV